MWNYVFLSHPTPAQLRQIIALYRMEGWWGGEAPDAMELAGRIVAGSHCFMAVFSGDEIIGMGRALSDGASDAYIQDVTVKKEYRHREIGTRIIEKLILRLHQDGLEWIGLIAEKDSYRFYERIGFKKMPNSAPMLMKKS